MSKFGRYSKVSRRKWGDERVRRLTPPPPSGFTLFDRFLTGPELTNIPGLFPAWEAGLAQALGWSLEAFRDAFGEVYREGLAEADWSAGLVWVPNAIKHNEPESLNVVIGWESTLADLPDCALKTKALKRLGAWCKSKGEAWAKAWAKACPIQEQEQEQEQEQRRRDARVAREDAPAPPSEHSETKHEHSEPPGPKPPSAGNLAQMPTRRARSTDDLRTCPIEQLANKCRVNPYDAGMAGIGERPELERINRAWSESVGLKARPLGAYSEKNRGLIALLEAFETTSEADLLRACKQAGRDDWCTGRKGTERDPARKRDVGCMSQTVIRRLLDACEDDEPRRIHPTLQKVLDEELARRNAAK